MYIAVRSQHTRASLYCTIGKLLYTYVRTYVCTHKHMHIICMCVYNKQNMYNRTTYVCTCTQVEGGSKEGELVYMVQHRSLVGCYCSGLTD